MIYKRRSAREGKVIVTFEIPGTIWTESVHLVGDFNNWERKSLPFQRDWKEDWIIELELDAGRQYRFRYLFDGGHWGNDWHADGYIDNPWESIDNYMQNTHMAEFYMGLVYVVVGERGETGCG